MTEFAPWPTVVHAAQERRSDEASLVQRAKDGDRAAWEDLYDQHHETLFRYALARLRTPHDADDIVSLVFLRALQNIRSYRHTGRPFVAWLYRIAQNLIKDELRRRRRHPEAPLADLDGVAVALGPETHLTRMELAAAVQRLKAEQRDVIILRFFVGLPTREVAAILRKREPAVYSLQVRAIEALRRQLM